ncbi:c-type cytochrome biogenesis protein CcmI [Celeribacter ethanolicus]|uniref:C-type cytochrome biogenesis protein CcmI n=1 Tax=Celeribacter ethanolicus TaxID=1758178 RepID=A0A291G8A8_9RHOB|nr:c-type cytochrome biogenesis protein CcmI [Celeribacter ethanolicus]ATG46659.1 c-type cytochrome biogenesis protein CcmI [Celeribacter ethanolicus]TNE66346.1 MAG: c-type cytochrome biogenesis protein CcmI [Paracoccaceae bacterium]
MTFWIIAFAIALLSAIPLALALRRAHGIGDVDSSTAEVEMKVYRDQLKEVDRDEARGVLSAEDAKRARIEVSRRLLDADKARASEKHGVRGAPIWAAAVLFAAVSGGALWLYNDLGAPGYEDLPLTHRIELAEEARANRPTQDAIEQMRPPSPPIMEPDERLTTLLVQLRDALTTRPDDLQGHILLARNEAVAGNYRAAYEAQKQVIRIKGPGATADDYADLADMMILAAGGFVSPEAEDALTKALQRDPQNGTAIYYSGLMFAQTGRPDMTFRLWQPLLSSSSAEDPWVMPIRQQIESVAQAAGIRYTLPPAPMAGGLRGPTQEDVEATADMTPEERQEMIRGMVEGLAARLANEGGSPEEWSRLISSLAMLGETERAKAIWGEAQVIFGATPEALAVVRQGAERAGLVE